jgi:hypothetical protein
LRSAKQREVRLANDRFQSTTDGAGLLLERAQAPKQSLTMSRRRSALILRMEVLELKR